jgi:hypothetical protein
MADRETFDRIRANTLEGVEPPDFDRLVDRAGRRRRRQTAVALAGAAVAVIAVVAATFQIGDPDRTQPPVDRPDLRLPATLDVGDAPGTPLVLEGLTQGSAPKVPWVEGDVFHGEAGDITLPGDQVSVRKFVALGDGVAQLVGPGAARVQLVSLEGDVFDEFAGSGILGSPDGGSLAWFDPASREAVLTSSQGEQTDRVPVPGTGDFVPVGWLDDNDVVLAPSDATRGRLVGSGAVLTSLTASRCSRRNARHGRCGTTATSSIARLMPCRRFASARAAVCSRCTARTGPGSADTSRSSTPVTAPWQPASI